MTYRPGYPTPRYPRIPAADPAPRDFSAKEIAAYDTCQERQHLKEAARAIRQDEIRIKRIEALMARDIDAYHNSPWPAEYSRLTGADKEAKERAR